jgi:hypothetical protein
MGTTQITFLFIRRIAAGIVLTAAPVVLMFGGQAAGNADQTAVNLHTPHHIVSNGYWVPR